MRRRLPVLAALLTVGAAVVCGCGSSSSKSADATDRTFLERMIPHHERAIAVARIAETRASDPRVLGFARRIVAEQTPQLANLRHAASDAGLTLDLDAGTRTAMNRITDAQVTSLRALPSAAFDERFLRLNVTSEQGAADMADVELAAGKDATALRIATSIASARHSQIPDMQRLATTLDDSDTG